MDKLENYIKENKQDFDSLPPDDIWMNINESLPQNKEVKRRSIALYKYASVILLIITAYLGYALIQNKNADSFESQLASIAPEYSDVKTYYNVKMTSGLKKIKDPSMKNELLMQLTKLDVLLEDLKSGLSDAPTSKQKEIMHRILNIYKQKVKILERVITADITKSASKQI